MFKISSDVFAALNDSYPVVALETAVLTHGMPKDISRTAYFEMVQAVTSGGALPAPVGLVGGVLTIGLSTSELEELDSSQAVRKAAICDLPVLTAGGQSAGTTAGATLFAARKAGIKIMATGGIGGVHRGAEHTFDISGDLNALGTLGGAVVCSGAKSLCDLPKTAQMLETLGVPVVGYSTSELPAFTSTNSGVRLAHRIDSVEDAARIMLAKEMLGTQQAVVFANPPPLKLALDGDRAEAAIEEAVREAGKAGISGPFVTPWILNYMEKRTQGASLAANRALLNSNAKLAAEIASAASRIKLTA